MEFVADFETTSVRVYGKDNKLDRQLSRAFVCAWAIIPVEAEPDPATIRRGRTVTGFLAYVEELYFEITKEKRKKLENVA